MRQRLQAQVPARLFDWQREKIMKKMDLDHLNKSSAIHQFCKTAAFDP
jgi:hypothetical protein